MASLSSELALLAQRYTRFAAECDGISPLYSFLSAQIAQDKEMLTFALACRPEQPPGNLLLGAVHYVLLQHPDDLLAAYYPSLTVTPLPHHEAYPDFKRFCRQHGVTLEEIISTHLVQTNEIRRCTYLLLAFAHIARRTAHQGIGEPLALLEIGASAGLNLLWDRYRYLYHQQGHLLEAGDTTSPVLLNCEVRGDAWPDLPTDLPPVAWRMGLDLNPLDLRNPEHYRWLRALIWPEHQDRVALLEDAHLIYLQHPPLLQKGDVATDLADVLDRMPAYATPVIFHTHVFNQVTPEIQAKVTRQLLDRSQECTLYRLVNDLTQPALHHFPLILQVYREGRLTEEHLADVDGHGRWLEWQLS